jgi:hypothetical protein
MSAGAPQSITGIEGTKKTLLVLVTQLIHQAEFQQNG